MKKLMLLSAVLAAFALAGCSVSVGGTDNVTTLENAIKNDLPTKLKESKQGDVTVSKVTCKADAGSDINYSCVASISGTDSKGRKGSADLDIAGTCRDSSCHWETR